MQIYPWHTQHIALNLVSQNAVRFRSRLIRLIMFFGTKIGSKIKRTSHSSPSVQSLTAGFTESLRRELHNNFPLTRFTLKYHHACSFLDFT